MTKHIDNCYFRNEILIEQQRMKSLKDAQKSVAISQAESKINEEQRTKSKIDSSGFDTCDAQLLQEAKKGTSSGCTRCPIRTIAQGCFDFFELNEHWTTFLAIWKDVNLEEAPHASRNQWNSFGIVARNLKLFHESTDERGHQLETETVIMVKDSFYNNIPSRKRPPDPFIYEAPHFWSKMSQLKIIHSEMEPQRPTRTRHLSAAEEEAESYLEN
ncbi:hypothetical protein CAEBREN_20555 [Caenorhabditis brenneri]|uniref:Uncharacterized protein n=1 Tax=Caenorhabditis brenneri TaxID=135651 RepID=G0NWZ9_CAEBE|nr:hypothetical protein CAEBREN_20555 [Caenorhabditis brenneri]